MPEAGLEVRLIDKTENPVAMIYAACRQCYSSMFAGDIYDDAVASKSTEKTADFIRRVIKSGHESPLEHVKFTFAIKGVSRALTHQLVRHRMASYSQQSQRYVKQSDFSYIIPPSFKKDEKLRASFIAAMETLQRSYNEITGLLKEKGVEGEKASQDARFVLPQAAETKIVVTMNCRELRHFFHHRCCARAQWEIRALADRMLAICREVLPEVFSTSGAKCVELGYCPEDRKVSCGRYPLRSEVIRS